LDPRQLYPDHVSHHPYVRAQLLRALRAQPEVHGFALVFAPFIVAEVDINAKQFTGVMG
jgi:hypothetical protein